MGKADFGDGYRKHTGRRAGPTVSSRTIVEAARAQFSRYGYEGTTTRTIAEDAGVDSALRCWQGPAPVSASGPCWPS